MDFIIRKRTVAMWCTPENDTEANALPISNVDADLRGIDSCLSGEEFGRLEMGAFLDDDMICGLTLRRFSLYLY